MLKKIESTLERFNTSTKEAKSVINDTHNLALETKELLALVDEHIQKTVKDLKIEVLDVIDQANIIQKKEMEERFKAERKHGKKMLLINVGILIIAVITFIFQRILV